MQDMKHLLVESRNFDNRRAAVIAVHFLLATAVITVYEQVANFDFVSWGDAAYIVDNPNVREGVISEGLGWVFTAGYRSNWHPLTWISHMVDCQLFGLDPAGHHLVGVGWHVLCTLFLFELLRRTTGRLLAGAVVAGFALLSLSPSRNARDSAPRAGRDTRFGRRPGNDQHAGVALAFPNAARRMAPVHRHAPVGDRPDPGRPPGDDGPIHLSGAGRSVPDGRLWSGGVGAAAAAPRARWCSQRRSSVARRSFAKAVRSSITHSSGSSRVPEAGPLSCH